jgi:hypothetical protein
MNTEDNYDHASSAGFNFGGHAGGGGEDSGDGGAIRKEGGGMACGRISGVAETLSPLGTDNVRILLLLFTVGDVIVRQRGTARTQCSYAETDSLQI